jgi:hypothetical protein
MTRAMVLNIAKIRVKYDTTFMVSNLPSRHVTTGFKAKQNAHSMCAQESSLHTYRIENGYRLTNVTNIVFITE